MTALPPRCDDASHCITCGDEAVPLRVLRGRRGARARALRGRRRRAHDRGDRAGRPGRARRRAARARGHGDREGARVKYVDEFRDAELGRAVAGEILSTVEPGRHYKVMEVCGGHTHSIYKYGVDDLLPANVELVHGPGCPVCVIPMGRVDDGIALAHEPGVIFTCFGDMMRVPGSTRHAARGEGRGRRRADGLLAARRAADREGEPRPRGRLLRDRLRDDRAVDRADAQAREGRGRAQLLRHVQPRDDRAAAARAARLARPAPRRLRRARATCRRWSARGRSSSSRPTTASRS